MSVANAVTRKNRLPNPLQRQRVDDLFLTQDAPVPPPILKQLAAYPKDFTSKPGTDQSLHVPAGQLFPSEPICRCWLPLSRSIQLEGVLIGSLSGRLGLEQALAGYSR
jgi:hypothetical protein